jgi:hypothetical protein
MIYFFPEILTLWENAEKYGRAGEATDYNIIRRKRFAFWVNMPKDTPSEYVILNVDLNLSPN